VDIDAVAGWLGSYGGEDSTSDISRGENSGTVTIDLGHANESMSRALGRYDRHSKTVEAV